MKNKSQVYGNGNLYIAYRTVRKDGSVKFDGNIFQHDFLKQYVGQRVWVQFEGECQFSIGPVSVRKIRGYKIDEICFISNYIKH